MRIKNYFKLLAAGAAVTLGVLSAQAQSAVHPKAYYDAITYEWTDASGASYTSAITEEATDPYQIVALLKKVYCDPNIPGPTYTAYDQNGNREREVYYGAISGGWDISASDVTAPYEDGYTILMVAVNENLSLLNTASGNGYRFNNTQQLINYIDANVKSVQLLTDGLRIGEGMNSGTAFNITGDYNRFFLLGKGQSRQKRSSYQNTSYGEQPPFMQMFEQFSPTDGGTGSEITDFYAKMVQGKAYPVIHDCSSVIENEHYFSMAGKANHETKTLTGLNIFIPDYRMTYWRTGSGYSATDGRTMNPNGTYWTAYYANYNQEHAPMVGIYTVDLSAEANPKAEAEKTYDVQLDRTSSLDGMAHGTMPQNYTVYIVLTDEDGNETLEELTVTDKTTFTYTVPQNEHSYTITYTVFAQPSDGEHDFFTAWSNHASVVIPGWNDFISLKLDHYESDFNIGEVNNYYRNFLSIVNDVNAITPNNIAEGMNTLTLSRYDANYDINEAPMVKVATITFTTGTNGRINYSVAYEDGQDIMTGYNRSQIDIDDSGNLGNYSGDQVIDLSAIKLVDQFAESTAENEHTNRYGYIMTMGEKNSNSVEVPVLKINSTINGYYTQADVDADVNHSLKANIKSTNVELNVVNNPRIYYYNTLHSMDLYSTPAEAISKIQRTTDGNFVEESNFLGMQGNPVNEVAYLLDKDYVGEPGDGMQYLPYIEAIGGDRIKNGDINTYGGMMMKSVVGNVDPLVSGTKADNPRFTWLDEEGQPCTIYNPILNITGIVPANATVEYMPYMYRVWRLCDNIRNYQIDWNLAQGYYFYINDEEAPREADKLIAEGYTSDSHFTAGDENDALAFGAVADNANIDFLVRFYYVKANRATGENAYYVVEKRVEWRGIGTSVNEISSRSNVASKTYVNAQGVKSDKPFDGLNIVITTYEDGTTQTSKLVR